LPRNSKSGLFSVCGSRDSGSVVGAVGRICGILTGGDGATDVHYCHFLVKHLVACGIRANILYLPPRHPLSRSSEIDLRAWWQVVWKEDGGFVGRKLEISVRHDGAVRDMWRIQTEAIRDYYYPLGFRARLSPDKRHWWFRRRTAKTCTGQRR
jgi:hypothetical protein